MKMIQCLNAFGVVAIAGTILIAPRLALAAKPVSTSTSVTKNSADQKSNSSTNENSAKSSVGTSHSFEDLLVQGKYQFADESVTTVEEDKVLDSLIGVRSDFKDRLKKSTARK